MYDVQVAPKLTIGIPLYNDETYIKQTILSIQQQKFEDFQLIILNDCSTDASREIVRNICLTDNRIILHDNYSNLGNLRNFINLLEYCDSEFFSWVGDHDLVTESYYQILIKELELNKSINYAYGHLVYIDEIGNEIEKSPDPRINKEFLSLTGIERFFFSIGMSRANLINFHGVYRSKILKNFNKRHQNSYVGWDHIVASRACYFRPSFNSMAEFKIRIFTQRHSTTYTRAVGLNSFTAKLKPTFIPLVKSFVIEYWSLPEKYLFKIFRIPRLIYIIRKEYKIKIFRNIFWEFSNLTKKHLIRKY